MNLIGYTEKVFAVSLIALWVTPLHMLPKKIRGGFCPCRGYRKLKSQHIANTQSATCAQILHDKTVFSTLDLHQAFHQIPVAPEDIQKTAITIPI